MAYVRRMMTAGALSLAVLLWACAPVPVTNDRYELRLRLVRHFSVPNYASANVSVANAVWLTGTVEKYDSANLLQAAWLPDDTCGLQVVASIFETTNQFMTDDSTLALYQRLSGGGYSYTADAINYFFDFRPLNYLADTVPVMIVPYLGVIRLDGSLDRFAIGGHAVWEPELTLASSVWLAATLIDLVDAESVLAHELGHLLLPITTFPDHATQFVNIMDIGDGREKYRRRVPGLSLDLEVVPTNDTNIRQLIEVQAGPFVHNQCAYALAPAANVLVIKVTP